MEGREGNDAMSTDYRTMITGIAGIQAAAMAAVVLTATRFVNLALREGELATTSLLRTSVTPQQAGESTWENAVTDLYQRQTEFLRTVAGLPRQSLLFFLGELDRIRGRRELPHESGVSTAAAPGLARPTSG
jgi:hypothetical protein